MPMMIEERFFIGLGEEGETLLLVDGALKEFSLNVVCYFDGKTIEEFWGLCVIYCANIAVAGLLPLT